MNCHFHVAVNHSKVLCLSSHMKQHVIEPRGEERRRDETRRDEMRREETRGDERRRDERQSALPAKISNIVIVIV